MPILFKDLRENEALYFDKNQENFIDLEEIIQKAHNIEIEKSFLSKCASIYG